MARFTIDEDTADDGYLYVDVDNIATIIIRRTPWEAGVHLEICAFGHAGEKAVKEVFAPVQDLRAARLKYNRKNRK
jgi:hypothetical protein